MSWPEALLSTVVVVCITMVLLALILGEDLVGIVRSISRKRGSRDQ